MKVLRLYKEPLQPQSIPRTPRQSQDNSSPDPRPSGSNRPTLSAVPPVVPGPRSYRDAYLRPATLPSPTAPCRAHSQRVDNGGLLLRDGIRDMDMDVSVTRHTCTLARPL
ncbi:hypothetical protein ElyMa_006188100 [Elysia marginata]|uniref:Uncharacterized protein n=1 Tax=Elysia marginata TaxID=1093978 RepID=A0AAV4H2J0_9GAST|nr:hypothetical protein ElyMa_006188100 [Elysia marginata]